MDDSRRCGCSGYSPGPMVVKILLWRNELEDCRFVPHGTASSALKKLEKAGEKGWGHNQMQISGFCEGVVSSSQVKGKPMAEGCQTRYSAEAPIRRRDEEQRQIAVLFEVHPCAH